MNKRYLGDSVYAECVGYDLVLTTENKPNPSNRIALKPPVLAALASYLDSLRPVAVPAHEAEDDAL